MSDLFFWSCWSPVGAASHDKSPQKLCRSHQTAVLQPAGRRNVPIYSFLPSWLTFIVGPKRLESCLSNTCMYSTVKVATHNETKTSGPRLIKAPTPWPNTEDWPWQTRRVELFSCIQLLFPHLNVRQRCSEIILHAKTCKVAVTSGYQDLVTL